MSYFLVSIAIIVLGVVMLWSDAFGKATGYIGIVASVVGFGLYVPDSIFPPVYDPLTETGIGDYIAILSVVGLEIWYILIALQLFRLGRGVQKEGL